MGDDVACAGDGSVRGKGAGGGAIVNCLLRLNRPWGGKWSEGGLYRGVVLGGEDMGAVGCKVCDLKCMFLRSRELIKVVRVKVGRDVA